MAWGQAIPRANPDPPTAHTTNTTGTGYLAWTLARILLGANRKTAAWPAGLAGVPVLASFLMVAWIYRSIRSPRPSGTVGIWQQGGNYFGVPFSNYLAGFLTVFVFFQLFAAVSARAAQRH